MSESDAKELTRESGEQEVLKHLDDVLSCLRMTVQGMLRDAPRNPACDEQEHLFDECVEEILNIRAVSAGRRKPIQ